MKKSQTQFTQPDFSLGRNEQDKAEQLYNNFYQGTRRQIEKDLKQFSTLNSIKRIFNKTLADPNDGQILEVVKRMEKDKLLAPMAFYIANKCQSQVFNLQKAILIK
ncbi:MAG: hypothetical protein ACK43K_02970, partial [Chitinophagales bacterium]